MQLIAIVLGLFANFIIYLSFGSLLTRRKGEPLKLGLSSVVGFFAYYSLFFVVCLPIMKNFRPLSLLTKIWVPIVIAIVILSAVLNYKAWYEKFRSAAVRGWRHKLLLLLLVALVALQVVIVTTSYNFTLDASYYVAGAATNVDTNMINVYDPFTGAWLDHYEMRYFFATYPVSDAVVCQLTGIAPLIWTKSVMAATVIILTNLLYYMIAQELFDSKRRPIVWMMGFMFLMNLFYVTIYTSSLFLYTRTYEGKAIVGNLSILAVLYMFILLVKNHKPRLYWVMLFLICFGSTTVSSSANMLIPAELSVLYLPDIVLHKRFRELIPYVICILPGVILALAFVAYVRGYFVFYTYPR